ncbi:MAG: LuxR family transcriptional regulator [Sphingomonadales bacterium]|nr:LuxR family transcriptional regulator [Sphingomonadales bacterium]MDE2567926.1 LuxR family transcriptional regulator [Sphingomonadales bacterium]
MSLVTTDERELLLPLAEGIHEEFPWHRFAGRLAARTGADGVSLVVTRGERGAGPVLEVSGGPHPMTASGIARLADSGLVPLAGLRPGRVYALDEFREPQPGEHRQAQRAALVEANVKDARMVRTAPRSELTAALVLFAARQEFRAADSALLSALVPHLEAALHTLAAMHALQRRVDTAEHALALLGIGTLAFDREARVLEADSASESVLGEMLATGRRLALAPEPTRLVEQACAAMAGDASAAARSVRVQSGGNLAVLLRPAGPAPALAPPVAAIGHVRCGAPSPGGKAAKVLAALYGLSANEAALAEALARGETIVEAGARLRLTSETARNYSKRIYAKTGARGQADLVRIVLSGLATLA